MFHTRGLLLILAFVALISASVGYMVSNTMGPLGGLSPTTWTRACIVASVGVGVTLAAVQLVKFRRRLAVLMPAVNSMMESVDAMTIDEARAAVMASPFVEASPTLPSPASAPALPTGLPPDLADAFTQFYQIVVKAKGSELIGITRDLLSEVPGDPAALRIGFYGLKRQGLLMLDLRTGRASKHVGRIEPGEVAAAAALPHASDTSVWHMMLKMAGMSAVAARSEA